MTNQRIPVLITYYGKLLRFLYDKARKNGETESIAMNTALTRFDAIIEVFAEIAREDFIAQQESS